MLGIDRRLTRRIFPSGFNMHGILLLIISIGIFAGTANGDSGSFSDPQHPAGLPGLQKAIAAGEKFVAAETTGSGNGEIPPANVAVYKSILVKARQLAARPGVSPAQADAGAARIKAGLVALQAQRISHQRDVEQLMAGVKSVKETRGFRLNCRTLALTAFGNNGFLAFASEPYARGTIVAGRYGQGRIVLLGSYLGCFFREKQTAKNPDGQRLAVNIRSWLSRRSPRSYPDALKTGKIFTLLRVGDSSTGRFDDPVYKIRILQVRSPLKERALFDPKTHPIALVHPRVVTPKIRDLLASYVHRGGSLLIGMRLGGKLSAQPAQELVSRAGILWTRQGMPLGGKVPPVEQMLAGHAMNNLALMRDAEKFPDRAHFLGLNRKEQHMRMKGVMNTFTALPKERKEAHRRLADAYQGLEHTFPQDVAARPYSKVVWESYLLAKGMEPGQQKAPSADHYPGSVPANAKRVTETLVFDFDQGPTPFRLQHRMSTGLYAPAGEDITIQVEKGRPYRDKHGKTRLLVQVGHYTAPLVAWGNPKVLKRSPVVAFTQQLPLGATVINNPFGGLIYLRTGNRDFRKAKLKVRITGAVRAPYFIGGKHTNADWVERIRNYPAPWAEIRARDIIATLPSSLVREFDNPEHSVRLWNRVFDHFYEFVGVSDQEGPPHSRPTLPHRIIGERQIYGGAALAGYPVSFGRDNHSFFEPDGIIYSTVFSEFGHNFATGEWVLPKTDHFISWFFVVYQQMRFGVPSALISRENHYDGVKSALAGGQSWTQLKQKQQFVFQPQIGLAFGWDVFTKMFRLARGLPKKQRPHTQEEKIAFFLVNASKFSGHDLTSYFEHYRVPIPDHARTIVKALKLPEPNPPVWTYREKPIRRLPPELRMSKLKFSQSIH